MSVRVIAGLAAALVLTSCGSSSRSAEVTSGSKAEVIELGDGTGYHFYPRDVPPGTISAQAAYNAMRGTRLPKTIPTFVTPRYGLLTQNDTSTCGSDAGLGLHLGGGMRRHHERRGPGQMRLLGLRPSLRRQGPQGR
jgi:hypothetical protein